MPKKEAPKTTTLESTAYLDGLLRDFHNHVVRYHELARHAMEIEAHMEIAEKTLILTRDHMEMALKNSEGDQRTRLQEWKSQSAKVRFVGVRLVDACITVLRESRKITPQRLLDAINQGAFRFRTNAPLREIHAALLRHPDVRREGDYYIWDAPAEEQMAMRVKGRKVPSLVADGSSSEPEGNNMLPN